MSKLGHLGELLTHSGEVIGLVGAAFLGAIAVASALSGSKSKESPKNK